MEPLFQHLKPETASGSPKEDRTQLARLLDLERHTLGQSEPRVVTDAATGRHFLVKHTLPYGVPDAAPYDRHYPSGMTPAGSEADLSARTGAVLDRLESAEVGYAPVMINDGFQKRHTLHETLGLPCGVDRSVPFRVSHAGGSSWYVTGGTFRWDEYFLTEGETPELYIAQAGEAVLPGTFLTTRAGFIGFWVPLSPVADEETGHVRFGVGSITGLVAESSYVNQSPTRFLPVPAGGGTDPEDAEFVEWSAGSMFVPLAFVAAPAGGRPLILPIIGGVNLRFFETTYSGPGLPTIFGATP